MKVNDKISKSIIIIFDDRLVTCQAIYTVARKESSVIFDLGESISRAHVLTSMRNNFARMA